MVKIGSNPEKGLIVLHPDYYEAGTATGEALRAHEMYHVMQRMQEPGFDKAFSAEAIRTEQAGKAPWENPYEAPAYKFEQQVKEHLLKQGDTE